MAATARPVLPAAPGLLPFLREELAPRPGRLAAVARVAGSCTLVVVIGMIYEIPLVPYMAYLVFLVSREEAASTLLTAAGGLVAVTFAVALSLLLYSVDAAEPALRLPLMAVSAFLGMWLSRILALGPLAFLASFVLVMSQTLIDRVPNLEMLTRTVLWLWVVAAVPVAVTVLVNMLVGEHPARLARRRGERLLRDLAAALRGGRPGDARLMEEAANLAELRRSADVLDPRSKGRDAIDLRSIETVAELSLLQRLLPPQVAASAREPLAAALDDCAAALRADRAPTRASALPGAAALASLGTESRPVVVAMSEAIGRLRDGLTRRLAADGCPAPSAAESPVVADAFANPEHVQYALKTTVAVMAAYVVYSAVAWPEISTAITTCFFVALGSFAETMHKLILRLSGAMLGGLLGALCIVCVLPHMTGIGELALLIGAASGLFAWVSTSSERLSYAGMQMAFAFFLGVMQGYGPTTELTVLRDRVLGILLGNLLIALAFTVLWPMPAVRRVRAALADALGRLGRVLVEGDGAAAGLRLRAVRALVNAGRLAALSGFEIRLIPGRDVEAPILGSAERVTGAVFTVVNQPAGAPSEADRARDRSLAVAIDQLAGALAGKAGSSGAAHGPAPCETTPVASDECARAARDLLQAELAHAFALCR